LFKNYLIVGLIGLVVALVLGVKPIQKVINETLNRGTLKGAETCIAYSGSELLSPDSTKASCVRSFQKRLYSNDLASGQAGPTLNQETVRWGGFLENKTPDHVTTWVQISIKIFDKDGAEQEFLGDTPVWIDPLSKADFEIELPDLKRELLDDIKFCGEDDKAPKACMGWGVVDIMGLEM
jgi:hypothetical protein